MLTPNPHEILPPNATHGSAAGTRYIAHVRLWAVVVAGQDVKTYRTRLAAQRHANRLNGEIGRDHA